MRCLLVQAETTTALANLEAICAVDGVHGVFIGPADLAASMGHRGNPEVQAAIEGAMQTIIASGKAAGTLTSDPVLAQRYLQLGCSFVAVGVDVLMFVNAARKLRTQFVGATVAAPAIWAAGRLGGWAAGRHPAGEWSSPGMPRTS